MRLLGKVVGFLMWAGAGLLLFLYWLAAMSKWLGLLGTILAFVLTPGFVVFPLVFWFVEGVFPTFYFLLMGIGLLGAMIFGVSMSGDD